MKLRNKVLAATTAALASANTFAYDWTSVTTAIDFSGEITAIAAIVGTLAGVGVVMVGGRKVLAMLGGR